MDEFDVDVVERVRVLELDKAGNYFQRLFRLVGGRGVGREPGDLDRGGAYLPQLPDGRPMRAIPFFLIGTGVARCPGNRAPAST